MLSDADKIIEINKFVDYENPDDFIYESIEKWRTYLIIIEEKIVGFLLYQFIWGKAPLISLLKIHSDFQKQGYGSRLLSRFENDLREWWYSNYYSSTEDSNNGSQSFHTKSWFKEIWRLTMKFWDEIYYGKQL